MWIMKRIMMKIDLMLIMVVRVIMVKAMTSMMMRGLMKVGT